MPPKRIASRQTAVIPGESKLILRMISSATFGFGRWQALALTRAKVAVIAVMTLEYISGAWAESGTLARSADALFRLQAAIPLTFRVSDAVRRRKVDGARTRGPRAMTYGDFDFGLIWARSGAAEERTYVKADRPLSGGREGCLKSDRPLSGGLRLLFGRPEADAGIPGSVVAAGSVSDGPCRVTTRVSRMMLRRMAGRAAGSGVPGSRL